MASASDYRAHAALQPADCLILLPQRLPAAVETSIRPAHYPAECTQSDAFLQPSLRARKGRANSNSLTFLPLGTCFKMSPTRRAARTVMGSPVSNWVLLKLSLDDSISSRASSEAPVSPSSRI